MIFGSTPALVVVSIDNVDTTALLGYRSLLAGILGFLLLTTARWIQARRVGRADNARRGP